MDTHKSQVWIRYAQISSAGAAIEAMDGDTPGQQLQHRYKNLQFVAQI